MPGRARSAGPRRCQWPTRGHCRTRCTSTRHCERMTASTSATTTGSWRMELPTAVRYGRSRRTSTDGEVNVIDLSSGEPKYKDAVEGGKNSVVLHATEGGTLYVYANKDHHLYAVNRQDGSYRALGPEIRLQGDEDPTTLEVRTAG